MEIKVSGEQIHFHLSPPAVLQNSTSKQNLPSDDKTNVHDLIELFSRLNRHELQMIHRVLESMLED